MTPPRPHAVVFDLDGTLIDSHPTIARLFAEAIAAAGLPAAPLLRREGVGPPLHELLPREFPMFSAEEHALVRREFVARYDAGAHLTTPAFACVPELLATLASAGVRLFVATNKRERPARNALAELALGPFDDLAASDSLGPDPPGKAALVGHLVNTHALAPERTWMVGDAPGDLAAAAAHGLVGVAAAYGYGTLPSLLAERPRFVAHTPHELLSLARAALAE